MNKCGTNAGYQKHCVDNTQKCDPCKNAHREYLQHYSLKNKENMLIKRRILYAKNAENNRNKRKEYYALNSEKEKSYQRKHKKENPHLKRESERRRRANRFNNGFEYYKESEVLSLYGYVCHICNTDIDLAAPRLSGARGWEAGLHIDHLVPLSKGGSDTLDNVRPAHGSCNVKKHANPLSK
jgi:5-methylcytosine-specific restriction endonuclease McrA